MGRGAQDTQPAHGLSVRGRGKHALSPAQTLRKAQAEGIELESLLDELVKKDPEIFDRAMRELFGHDLPLASQLAARKIITIASPRMIQSASSLIKRCESGAYYKHFLNQEHQDAKTMSQRITEDAPELIKQSEKHLTNSVLKRLQKLSSAPDEYFYSKNLILAFAAMSHENINWIAQRLVHEHETNEEPIRLSIEMAVRSAYRKKYNSYLVHATTAHLQKNPVIQFTYEDRQALVRTLIDTGNFTEEFSRYLCANRSLDKLLSYSTKQS